MLRLKINSSAVFDDKYAAGHDQYKAWASLLKTDYGLYMVGGSHTETSIELKEGAVGCRVSRKR